MYLSSLLFLCISMLSGLVLGQELKSTTHPLRGKVVNAQSNFLSESAVMNLVRQHRYVFVGEKHDNPEHHQIELRLIQERFKSMSLAGQGRVVFEMLDDSHETAIPHLKTADTIEQMQVSLNWPKKGSWDWRVYAPLFQEALKNSALAAGNIDRAFISNVYKNGDKSFVGNDRFATALNPPLFLKDYLLDQIFKSHCGLQSRETLMPMLHIQLAKDASMASAMLRTSAAMLIAGGEHARTETGAPWHLRRGKPESDVLIIQMIEVQEGNEDLKSYMEKAGKADLYWFTAATESKDYCADVKGKAAQ
jgi:uncharacterized iron-regulated protein